MQPAVGRLVSPTPPVSTGRLDRWCATRIAQALSGAAIRIELWDGFAVDCGDASDATVRVHDRATLMRLLLHPSLEFGEAYAAGRLTVEGDLVALLESANRALNGRPYESRPKHARGASTERAARSNVHTHYDLGNDFYRLWLDQSMAYTCAYFPHPDTTLEDAQRAKYEHVCRKVELRPGDRVIDAGCGWGGLALHMARHHGVTVRAFNVSGEQLEWARSRAHDEGLADQVTFIDRDYRFIDGQADVFVSVGMLEHVGPNHYKTLGHVIDRVLDPERGRGLLHFIGRNHPQPFNPWITRHIFPGAYAPTLSEMLPGALEAHHFSVLDVENLRRHYALTIRHWRDRFEVHAGSLGGQFDDEFVRTWRLYLAGAEASFLSGDLQLFQVAFARPTADPRAWTRRSWYGPEPNPPM